MLSDQDPLHTEVTSICMCLPVAVSLSTFVCVLYAHLFADIFHRDRGREGVGSWLLRVCGIGSFVFPSNIFHSSSFQFTKMLIHSHEQFVFGVNLSCVAVAIVATVLGTHLLLLLLLLFYLPVECVCLVSFVSVSYHTYVAFKRGILLVF